MDIIAILKVCTYILLCAVPASTFGAVSPEFKSHFDLAFVAPIELRNSKTSTSDLLMRLSEMSNIGAKDVSMFMDAISGQRLDAVGHWVSSRENRVLTSQSEILKEAVARLVTRDSRPGPEPYIMTELRFYSTVSNLIRSITHFGKSGAGRLAESMPDDILASCTAVLRGQSIPRTDLAEIRNFKKALLSGNLVQHATAINLCNLVILDQSGNVAQFLDENTTLPVTMVLQVVVNDTSGTDGHTIQELMMSAFKAQKLDLNLLIFMLYTWDNEVFVNRIAQDILSEENSISGEQRAQLYWLLRNSQEREAIRLKATEKLEYEALFDE